MNEPRSSSVGTMFKATEVVRNIEYRINKSCSELLEKPGEKSFDQAYNVYVCIHLLQQIEHHKSQQKWPGS